MFKSMSASTSVRRHGTPAQAAPLRGVAPGLHVYKHHHRQVGASASASASRAAPVTGQVSRNMQARAWIRNLSQAWSLPRRLLCQANRGLAAARSAPSVGLQAASSAPEAGRAPSRRAAPDAGTERRPVPRRRASPNPRCGCQTCVASIADYLALAALLEAQEKTLSIDEELSGAQPMQSASSWRIGSALSPFWLIRVAWAAPESAGWRVEVAHPTWVALRDLQGAFQGRLPVAI